MTDLFEEYGTEKGASRALAGLAATALGYGAIAQDQNHVSELMAQAEMMNQASRIFEEQKMRQTISALEPKLASVAAEAGVALVRAGMNKEAVLGLLGRGAGALVQGAGKAVGALGKSTKTQSFLRAARQQGVAPTGVSGGVGGALRGAGVKMQQAGKQLKAPSAAGSAAPAMPQAATAVAATAKKKSEPLIGLGTKAKILGAAGLAGAGYAGLKGVQATRDYMMTPSGHSAYGRGVPRLMHNVNEQGYPQY
jgi:hypothetical protein